TNINSSGVASTTTGCVLPSGTGNRISQGFPTTVPLATITPAAALSTPQQPASLAPGVGAFDPNLKNPSVHEWSLTVQREVPLRIVAEIGYIGKRGTHLYRAYDLNQVAVNQPGLVDSFNIAKWNLTLNGQAPFVYRGVLE